jgi:hypothetical protein
MALKDYLNTHHVFNMREFKAAFPGSVTDLNLLARAVRSGKVDRVRSGLFVSRSERFFDVEPPPFVIATKTVDDATFCYMATLRHLRLPPAIPLLCGRCKISGEVFDGRCRNDTAF